VAAVKQRRGCSLRGARPIALLAAACTAPPAAAWRAEAWPAADALFRGDPRWRGSDAAYSVDLGQGRTLWLFGDTFVRPAGAAGSGRQGCTMVRNSIAVQVGADPTAAAIAFATGGTAAAPDSWFPQDGEVFHWPLAGLRHGDSATVFCTRVVNTPGEGLGFRAVGWTAFRLGSLDGPVAAITREPLAPFAAPFPVVVGTALVRHGAHVHAFALREPGDHAVFLLRWSEARFAAGELAAAEWHDGGRWVSQRDLASAPVPVLAEGAPEFTVHRAADGTYVMVQSLGFGGSDLAVRTAPAPAGPWREPRVVFRPAESDRPGLWTYAGKAHPQLHAGGALLATYASNAWDFARLVADEAVYFPRFVRLEPRLR
jgi:hypothetical protein